MSRRDGETVIGRIVSLQVGTPRVATTKTGRVWESAIVKGEVGGRVALSRTNLAGDEQADKRHHGGPDKAVCCYAAEHYPDWRDLLGMPMPHGAFGENFTLEGLTEDVVCIGDVFAIEPSPDGWSAPDRGSAPDPGRVMPSFRSARPMALRLLVSLLQDRPGLPPDWKAGRTISCLRVLQEAVGAGDALTLWGRHQLDSCCAPTP